jgi:hypothetical protein
MTVTELIPLATTKASPAQIYYTAEDGKDPEPVEWRIGLHVVIYGGGRIFAKEDTFCFNMLQYVKKN